MTQQQQNLIRRLKIALLVVLILSIYMTGIVLSISVVKSTLNPFRLIRLFGEYGFPWKMFLGCFLFIGIAISILMAYSVSEEAGVDKMGRLFSMAIGRKTYGEAHFEDPKEYEDVAIIQHEPQAVGTILGQLDETGRYPIVFREDKMNRHRRVRLRQDLYLYKELRFPGGKAPGVPDIHRPGRRPLRRYGKVLHGQRICRATLRPAQYQQE